MLKRLGMARLGLAWLGKARQARKHAVRNRNR